jgi:hypothetical protein
MARLQVRPDLFCLYFFFWLYFYCSGFNENFGQLRFLVSETVPPIMRGSPLRVD